MIVTLAGARKQTVIADARAVSIWTERGQIGILRNHADLIALVAPGPITIEADSGTVRGFVSAGSLRVERGDVFVAVEHLSIGAPDLEAAQTRRTQLTELLASDSLGERTRERLSREAAYLDALLKSYTEKL